MKKDVIDLWEQEGDLERMKIFFNHLDGSDEQKERIKRLALQKIEQSQEDKPNVLVNELVDEKIDEYKDEQIDEKQADEQRVENSNIFQKALNRVKGFSHSLKWRYAIPAALLLFVIFIGKTGMGDAFPLLSKSSDGVGVADTQNITESSPGVNESADMAEIYNSGRLKEFSQESSSNQSIAVAPDLPQPEHPSPPADDTLPRKITYDIFTTVQVEDVSLSIEEVSRKIENFKGYVVESSINEYENESTGHLTLKIPSSRLNEFKDELSQIGKVMNQNMNANDITNQYYDAEARLRSYQAQEERYLELLNEAKTVEDILNIESNLNNIRVQIEQLQGRLKLWDHEVSYSTVEINLQTSSKAININNPWQPVSWGSTWLAAKSAFLKTISSAWNALNYLVVGIAYALPVIFLLGVVIGIYRAFKNSRK